MAGSSCRGLDWGPTTSAQGGGWAGRGQGSWRQQGSEKVCEVEPFQCG